MYTRQQQHKLFISRLILFHFKTHIFSLLDFFSFYIKLQAQFLINLHFKVVYNKLTATTNTNKTFYYYKKKMATFRTINR